MFFTFPEDGRWNAGRDRRVPRRGPGPSAFQRLLPERPAAERCFEAFYVQRTRFEKIAERGSCAGGS